MPIPLYEQSRALLIGNSKYKMPWTPLPKVDEAVSELSNALRPEWTIIRTIINAELYVMYRAITRFFRTAGKNDRLFFYYAGHGHTEQKVLHGQITNRYVWLIPSNSYEPYVNTSAAYPYVTTALPIKHLIVEANKSKAKHAMIVINACQANGGVHENLQILFRKTDNRGRNVYGLSKCSQNWEDSTNWNKRSRTYLTSGFGFNPVSSGGAFDTGLVGALQFSDIDGADGVYYRNMRNAVQKTNAPSPDSIIDPHELAVYTINHRVENHLGVGYEPQLICVGEGRLSVLSRPFEP